MRTITFVDVNSGAIRPVTLKCLFLSRLRVVRTQLRKAAARFTPEAEAQERTIKGPGLPHHRHPMTLDELIAGIITWAVLIGSAVYVGWRYF